LVFFQKIAIFNQILFMKKIIGLFLISFALPLSAQTVTTLAGATGGSTNGPFSSALFNGPNGMAFDPTGNLLYLVDRLNERVRTLDLVNSTVTTLAGSTQGFANGLGSAAQFNGPTNATVDNSGNVYVTDFANSLIRMITPAGMVSTFAGSSLGGANGPNLSAQFNHPSGITCNSAGELFVVDRDNSRIRKISGGNVTTLAGSVAGFADGPGSTALFNSPYAITIDNSGTYLYIADQFNHKIRRVSTATGSVNTIAGGSAGYADGPSSSALFNNPGGICVDANGNLYIADTGNHKIRKIDASGNVTTVAGATAGFANGVGTSALFNNPANVSVNAAGNTLYIADYSNNRVRKIDLGSCVNASIPSVVSNPSALCVGGTVTLTLTGNLNGATSWKIYGTACGTNSVASTSTNTVALSPGSTTTYYIRGEGGCTTPGACTMITIAVNQNPTLTVTGGTAVCAGSPISQTVTGATSYTWSTGSNTGVAFFTPSVTTTYSVSGTLNGCSASATTTISVNQLPVVTASTSASQICIGQSATLTVSGANYYNWSNGATVAVVVVSPTANTTYSVSGTDLNGCTNTDLITVNASDCAGIESIGSDVNVQIYPNPSTGVFYVRSARPAELLILNALGQAVFVHHLETGENTIQSNLPGGFYYFVVSGGNLNKQGKLVIE